MVSYCSYYNILDITDNSSIEEIKTAFRKLSLVHHPDKNNNSPESNTKFKLILNAYNTLIDPVKRKEYDTYLRKSTVLTNLTQNAPDNKLALPGKSGDVYRSNETLLNHFNFLLWDIEEFIHNKNQVDWDHIYGKLTRRQYVLKILTFIDKWVLIPSGFQDYFMEARKMKILDPIDYVNIIGISHGTKGHIPYAGITDYFYDIRKRMDRFLENITAKDLIENIPNHEIRLIDCIVEAQNYAVHYLSYLFQMETGLLEDIPAFKHSNTCFVN
jgi:hypothetical protein